METDMDRKQIVDPTHPSIEEMALFFEGAKADDKILPGFSFERLNTVAYALRLMRNTHPMRAALERIALPNGCGCRPCTGQCKSQNSLLIELDEIKDAARNVLTGLESQ